MEARWDSRSLLSQMYFQISDNGVILGLFGTAMLYKLQSVALGTMFWRVCKNVANKSKSINDSLTLHWLALGYLSTASEGPKPTLALSMLNPKKLHTKAISACYLASNAHVTLMLGPLAPHQHSSQPRNTHCALSTTYCFTSCHRLGFHSHQASSEHKQAELLPASKRCADTASAKQLSLPASKGAALQVEWQRDA